MTLQVSATSARAARRTVTQRTFLMCAPAYFDVVYAINPWMDPGQPVDVTRALAQWQALREAYERRGHTVHVIDPVPGLPDMVYAANGGLVIGGRAITARFRYEQRWAETPAYERWFDAAARAGVLGPGGSSVGRAAELNEGEGDLLLAGRYLLAGTGFRTSPAGHAEVAARLGLAAHGITLVPLDLVDPRYYHLDTALTVLDPGGALDAGGAAPLVAYLPEAFSPASRTTLRTLFPDAILATPDDAAAFGLNAVSDGRHVYLNAAATAFADTLRGHGFEPVPVEIDELIKGGGAVKCCTLVIRPAPQNGRTP